MGEFTVYVADNFHHGDDDETYEHGEYATYARAVAAAKRIVDAWLKNAYEPGANPDDLYQRYASFGDDPYVVPEPEGKHFSAWEYAKQRCQELCAPGDHQHP
jgi:hypothetical protein